jgi:hypothetical protein
VAVVNFTVDNDMLLAMTRMAEDACNQLRMYFTVRPQFLELVYRFRLSANTNYELF